MNRDDIIRMAREAGIIKEWMTLRQEDVEALGRFAAAEREACAKVCESLWNYPENGMATEEECYGNECAAAIRARGETK